MGPLGRTGERRTDTACAALDPHHDGGSSQLAGGRQPESGIVQELLGEPAGRDRLQDFHGCEGGELGKQQATQPKNWRVGPAHDGPHQAHERQRQRDGSEHLGAVSYTHLTLPTIYSV